LACLAHMFGFSQTSAGLFADGQMCHTGSRQ
jgi:hypothetical protein